MTYFPEVKMQMVLRLAGDMQREVAVTDSLKRRRVLRRAIRAAEWYAGYLLQETTGWSDEEIIEAGFPLEPIRRRIPPAGGLS